MDGYIQTGRSLFANPSPNEIFQISYKGKKQKRLLVLRISPAGDGKGIYLFAASKQITMILFAGSEKKAIYSIGGFYSLPQFSLT